MRWGSAVVFTAALVFGMALGAGAEEINCLMCHEEYSKGKVVHAAVEIGCPTCHTGVDATDVPHKITTKFPKGLPSEISDLCYRCHDKAKFYAPTIHAPVGVGMCTACHDPHRSEHNKLLLAGKTAICFNCHEVEKLTGKKIVHQPVKAGNCFECHAPHASSNQFLIVSKGNILCRKCHPKVEKEPHGIQGFRAGGHPVRGKSDPKRKGKTFECLSCHAPHSSDWGKLFRYSADSTYDLCIHCHGNIYY